MGYLLAAGAAAVAALFIVFKAVAFCLTLIIEGVTFIVRSLNGGE